MTGYVTENQLVDDRSVGFLFISYVIYLQFLNQWSEEPRRERERERDEREREREKRERDERERERRRLRWGGTKTFQGGGRGGEKKNEEDWRFLNWNK